VGQGQVILFAAGPTFRTWLPGMQRPFFNAVLLGPGMVRLSLSHCEGNICFLVFFTTGDEPMATVLKLDEIKNLVDIPQLIQDIEAYQ
jgi:hypothetical protein